MLEIGAVVWGVRDIPRSVAFERCIALPAEIPRL